MKRVIMSRNFADTRSGSFFNERRQPRSYETLYCVGALMMGLALLAVGVLFTRSKSFLDARRLLKASVIYLPLLLLLIIIDAGF